MEMKRVEADTLEEAYSKAAKELSCSVTEINYEIIQHPSVGVMGLFKKSAIIIAVRKQKRDSLDKVKVVEEKKKTLTDEKREIKVEDEESKEIETSKESSLSELKSQTLLNSNDKIVDNFFNEDVKVKEVKKVEKKVEVESPTLGFDDDRDHPENKKISIEIEEKILKLIEVACFEIDVVEVDVFNGIAHIFIDGEDAALLIGKEGYRYNALSYMFFNWINSHYNLYIKLEIAEFIQSQEEMIDNFLKPIAEHIIEHGRGKTKPLDGILVQIALEKLRAMFPNKYIAIKTGKDGKKFIIINDFNSKKVL